MHMFAIYKLLYLTILTNLLYKCNFRAVVSLRANSAIKFPAGMLAKTMLELVNDNRCSLKWKLFAITIETFTKSDEKSTASLAFTN